MTEISRFWTTDGTGDGPLGGYSADQYAAFLEDMFGMGVLTGVLNELFATAPGGVSPISLATGAAIVAGFEYQNTAPLNLPVASPVIGTTGFRIVLSAIWATQQVRAAVILNVDGNSGIPAFTQNPGVQVDLPLFTGTITVGGVIVIVEGRTWAQYSTKQQTIGPGGITTAMLADGAVTEPKIASNAVTKSKIKNLSVSGSKIEDNAVNWSKLYPGSVLESKIADNAVTSAKIKADTIKDSDVKGSALTNRVIGSRVVKMPYRQGGVESNWTTPGANQYTLNSLAAQLGASSVTIIAGATEKFETITFDISFLKVPLVFCQLGVPTGGYAGGSDFSIFAINITTTTFDLVLRREAGTATPTTATIYWMAIGQEK
jgi:hypothetical protein